MVAFPSFSEFFHALWTYEPFPWQRMLVEQLAEGEWPKALDLPTAAGKTACIDIAIYALASQAEKPVWERTAPRRIWFVVDRRIVVDEAFERAREIAEKLREATDGPLKAVADRLLEIGGTQRPLAVGRLRGGVLRDDSWARLPSQPAVITSTVDQLGSRLMFRGYGHSALTASIFAGLAAHDSLILLDEAHLSVPFMQTLRAVERYRGKDWAEQPIETPFAFSILSATPPLNIPETEVFPGVQRDAALDHPKLAQRINASKPAELVMVKTGKSRVKDPLVEAAVDRAAAFAKTKCRKRIAVIVNRVRTAETVAQMLKEQHGAEIDVVLLTGRLRPFERDQLVTKWKPVLKANKPEEPERLVVLVATQCIEVGADFSFDALITEAASLDALRQRFGRLNRLGTIESAPAILLTRDQDIKANAEDFIYGTALRECWNLLQGLCETHKNGKREQKIINFGIASLDELLQTVDDLAPLLAPAPDAPLLLPSHVDLLCQTSPRPQVEPDIQLYLHGMDHGAPEVRVVWRADLDEKDTENWLETIALCPPNSAETVTVPLYQFRQWITDGAQVDDSGDVEGARHSEPQVREQMRPALRWRGRERSKERSLVCSRASQISPNELVVLPAAYGMEGLGQSAPKQTMGQAQLDIWEPSHARSGKPVALRLHREVLKPWLSCPPLQALIEIAEGPAWERDNVRDAIDTVLAYRQESEEEAPTPPDWWLDLLKKVRSGRYDQHPAGGLVLRKYTTESQKDGEQDLFADDDDLLSAAGKEVNLEVHSASVERAAEKLLSRCLSDEFHEPLITAAYWHDIGKLDERFQIMLCGGNEPAVLTGEPLAKSMTVPSSPERRRAIRSASKLPDDFRHEMLSLQLAEHKLFWQIFPNADNDGLNDLTLHAIASHHGYGRPFAPISLDENPLPVRGRQGGIDFEVNNEERASWPATHTLKSGISERFWRLNRRYGWWGLAYLEAILRLSDWYGSERVLEGAPKKRSRPKTTLVKVTHDKDKSFVLEGIDGSNPLGFLAAVGTLVVLHQAGYKESRMAWQHDRIAWRPRLNGAPIVDHASLSELLAKNLAATVSVEADEKQKQAEEKYSLKKREINDKRNEIKKRGLRGKEREQALDEEIASLERELEVRQKTWLVALRQSAPKPELALGKNIDCTEAEYRSVVEPLLEDAGLNYREALDLLTAFCSMGCLHESQSKRKDGKLASTPFAFISGSGHQDFLNTAGKLMQYASTERVTATLFAPWTYEDELLSLRWDPVEDRRYALMDRDPTASNNKPRTVWMANLLAYRALALFPSAPLRSGLTTVGWQKDDIGEHFFTWPLWSYPLDPDSIRSLFLLSELYLEKPDSIALYARGVETTFRSRRIKVGTGANFKINFSLARAI